MKTLYVKLLSVISVRSAIHVGRDEKMLLGFVDFPNLAQGFSFASRKAISEASEFSKSTRWVFARAVIRVAY